MATADAALPAEDDDAATSWTIRLALEAYATVERELFEFLSGVGVDGHAAYTSQLVVEEIVRNLIEHTPPYATDETVTVRVAVDAASVTVQIEDRRPAFSPYEGPPLDVAAPLEARRAGGMGLHLVREMTDDLAYERVEGRNRLTAVIARG